LLCYPRVAWIASGCDRFKSAPFPNTNSTLAETNSRCLMRIMCAKSTEFVYPVCCVKRFTHSCFSIFTPGLSSCYLVSVKQLVVLGDLLLLTPSMSTRHFLCPLYTERKDVDALAVEYYKALSAGIPREVFRAALYRAPSKGNDHTPGTVNRFKEQARIRRFRAARK
jgi:hypothetical protein